MLKPEGEAVKAVSSILIRGGVAVYPSDTVYGLLADGFSESACRRLCLLKGYIFPRPFILLVKSISEALSLTAGKNTIGEMEKHWPGPVTLVMTASQEVPPWLLGPGNSIAVRVPADPLSREILHETSLRLASTSANTAGEPSPLSIENVAESILNGADAVIDGGYLRDRTPSRIIDITGDEPKILR